MSELRGRYSCAEDHSNVMGRFMNMMMARKYAAGQKEHGGELWKKPMLDHMLAEIVDLVHYYLTHRAQVELALEELECAYPAYTVSQDPDDASTFAVTKAYNILKFGDASGVPSEELAPDTWNHLSGACPCPPEGGNDREDDVVGECIEGPPLAFDDIEEAMADNEPEYIKSYIPGDIDVTEQQHQQMGIVLDGLKDIVETIFPGEAIDIQIAVGVD